jgi:hypothetical protein
MSNLLVLRYPNIKEMPENGISIIKNQQLLSSDFKERYTSTIKYEVDLILSIVELSSNNCSPYQ